MKRVPFHVILIGVFPILAFLANNISEVYSFWVILRPMIVSLIGNLILFGVVWLLLRNIAKSALITTFLFTLFFSYGFLYNYLHTASIYLGRHRNLIIVYLIVLLLGLWGLKKIKDCSNLVQIVNFMSIILVLFPIIQISSYSLHKGDVQTNPGQTQNNPANLIENNPPERPDIYYLVLDSYTRGDVLKDIYDFDNSTFLDELKNLGFYIADCSKSNYALTRLSIASTMNLNYLSALDKKFNNPEEKDTLFAADWVINSFVRQQLEAIGYKTVYLSPMMFGDPFIYTPATHEYQYLDETANSAFLPVITGFEGMLLENTGLKFLIDVMPGFAHFISLDMIANFEHIRSTLFLLDSLEKITTIPGPKFVYLQVIVPHGPFIFSPDGSIHPETSEYADNITASYKKGYTDQVLYINSRILKIVKDMLSKPGTSPIIILQGDHGMRVENRMDILNVYYLPNGVDQQLYPSISPVNSFRVIFNRYFGGRFELLEDKAYYSKSEAPFYFELRPETSPACVK